MKARQIAILTLLLAAAGVAGAETPDGEVYDPASLAGDPPPGASFEDYDHLVPETPEGGISWDLLGNTEERVEIIDGFSYLRPVFSDEVRALDGERVRIKGFIYPLEQTGNQGEFLFTALPPSCPYCLPAGAGYIIEAHAKDPLRFTWDAILVEGRLELLEEHEYGLFFRLSEVERIRE